MSERNWFYGILRGHPIVVTVPYEGPKGSHCIYFSPMEPSDRLTFEEVPTGEVTLLQPVTYMYSGTCQVYNEYLDELTHALGKGTELVGSNSYSQLMVALADTHIPWEKCNIKERLPIRCAMLNSISETVIQLHFINSTEGELFSHLKPHDPGTSIVIHVSGAYIDSQAHLQVKMPNVEVTRWWTVSDCLNRLRRLLGLPDA